MAQPEVKIHRVPIGVRQRPCTEPPVNRPRGSDGHAIGQRVPMRRERLIHREHVARRHHDVEVGESTEAHRTVEPSSEGGALKTDRTQTRRAQHTSDVDGFGDPSEPGSRALMGRDRRLFPNGCGRSRVIDRGV
jgi:hypothetical protein